MAGAWMTMTVVNFSSRGKKLFLLLLFFVSLRMNTSAETRGLPPKSCTVCEAECASQWKRVYKSGVDSPIWERQEHHVHCSRNLKLTSSDFICQYNNRFIVVTYQDNWTYIFEATDKYLNTVTEPCPEFRSDVDSQKHSRSQHSHSWNWTVWVLIIASIRTLWWLLIQ